MNLITQIGNPSATRSRSDTTRSSATNGLQRSNTRNGGGLSRRQSKRAPVKKDEDGWETVSRKK